MRIEKHSYETIHLTREEKEAFELVDKILDKIYCRYFSNASLESQLTGECVEMREIPRVRGILGFFTEINQIVNIVETE